ncbi:MAG TPA: ABC transporter substrate-binding protein [Sphingobium sp.]|uniref:ABC transporter substrate-binding protein n=1 Tax=Sphingobium sp. TaxID=1912891 RepID=UPI002ED0D3CB
MNEISMTMNRRTLVKGSVALAATTLAGCGARSGGKAGEVIVCDGGGSWGRAQRLAFHEPFTRETGVRVRTVPFVMPGKLRTSIEQKMPVIDVADMGAVDMPRFIRDGLLTPLDRSAFDPAVLAGLSPVKASEFAVPALYSAIVLAYRNEALGGREPAGWQDFWNVAVQGGGCSLATGTLGVMGATFPIALLGDGVAPKDLYPLDWDRLFRSLDRIKPHIRKFWASGGEPVQMLADRNVVMSSAWNGRIDTARTDIRFTWNQALTGAGYWAVPKGAQNRENAFRFMAFALRPDRQAHFSELNGYGPANAAAFKLLTPERAALMPNSPDALARSIDANEAWWAKEDRPGETNADLAVRLWEAWIARNA